MALGHSACGVLGEELDLLGILRVAALAAGPFARVTAQVHRAGPELQSGLSNCGRPVLPSMTDQSQTATAMPPAQPALIRRDQRSFVGDIHCNARLYNQTSLAPATHKPPFGQKIAVRLPSEDDLVLPANNLRTAMETHSHAEGHASGRFLLEHLSRKGRTEVFQQNEAANQHRNTDRPGTRDRELFDLNATERRCCIRG